MGMLDFEDLKKMGVVLKRALYFITCKGKMMYPIRMDEDYITRNLLNTKEKLPEGADGMSFRQLSLFDDMGIE
jgi:predicted DNA-binding helix-hairpin-helix protein